MQFERLITRLRPTIAFYTKAPTPKSPRHVMYKVCPGRQKPAQFRAVLSHICKSRGSVINPAGFMQ
jgi:hypothetical protein